jgi:hypothetical protein
MDEASVWAECVVRVETESIFLTPSAAMPDETLTGGERAGALELPLLGSMLTEFPTGRPGKGSLISNYCLQLVSPLSPSPSNAVERKDGGATAVRTVLLKAQSRADYNALTSALRLALAARADNTQLERLQRVTMEAEGMHADALLRTSLAMLAAACGGKAQQPSSAKASPVRAVGDDSQSGVQRR